jgi:hypothetical protein
MSLQFQTRGVVAMTIPAPPSGIEADDDDAGSEQPTSNAPEFAPTAPSATSMAAASMAAAPALAYAEFAAALKNALRDVHSPDLLARNPLLGDGICNFGGLAGPLELKALLSETVSTLFDNARDEKLRRVVELTYFEPGLKQEVVADRLSLSFGTYRRRLSAARERLARWLWERSRVAQRQTGAPSVARIAINGKHAELETTASPEAGAREAPRLSIVVMPFLNIGGAAQDDPFIDGITETLTTDLARFSGVFAISRSTAFTYKG